MNAAISSSFSGYKTPPSETSSSFLTSAGRAWIVDRAGLLNSAVWKETFAQHCKDHRYYEIVEETLSGKFDYRYFVLENEQTAALAIQPFFFVKQDLIAGLPRNLRAMIDPIRRLFPRFLT